MVYGDKSTYTGQWFDDKRHGKGKMTIFQKDGVYVYEGDWASNQKSGEGKYTWPNPMVWYEGKWAHDKRNGKGTATYPDGSEYRG